MDLVAAVWKLATHDIYECPVFATATDRPTAVVYTAWGLRIPEDETKVRIEVHVCQASGCSTDHDHFHR